MNERITQKHILQFVYGELNADAAVIVKKEMTTNPELMHYYNQIIQVKEQLNLLNELPDPTSIAIVREYAHDNHKETV